MTIRSTASCLISLTLSAIPVLSLQASPSIWNSATTTNWASDTAWNPPGAPGPTADVVFTNTARGFCVITSDVSCASLNTALSIDHGGPSATNGVLLSRTIHKWKDLPVLSWTDTSTDLAGRWRDLLTTSQFSTHQKPA